MDIKILKLLVNFLGISQRRLLEQDEELLKKLEIAALDDDFLKVHHLAYKIK